MSKEVIVVKTKEEFDSLRAADKTTLTRQLVDKSKINQKLYASLSETDKANWPIIHTGTWPCICQTEAELRKNGLRLTSLRTWDAAEVEISRQGVEWGVSLSTEERAKWIDFWKDAEMPDVILSRFKGDEFAKQFSLTGL